MFKNSGYNLSDIAAVTRGNDGMFGDGNGAWWLILLFLFGWGWGGNGGFGGAGNENVRDAVAYGFDINNLENGEVVAKCDIEPLAEMLCEALQKRLNE